MKEIRVDISNAQDGFDFYGAIAEALDAPDWHGRNLNAVMESLTFGGNGTLSPPFVIVLEKVTSASRLIQRECKHFASLVAEHCEPNSVSVRLR